MVRQDLRGRENTGEKGRVRGNSMKCRASERGSKYTRETGLGTAHRSIEIDSSKLQELAKNKPKLSSEQLQLTLSLRVVIWGAAGRTELFSSLDGKPGLHHPFCATLLPLSDRKSKSEIFPRINCEAFSPE